MAQLAPQYGNRQRTFWDTLYELYGDEGPVSAIGGQIEPQSLSAKSLPPPMSTQQDLNKETLAAIGGTPTGTGTGTGAGAGDGFAFRNPYKDPEYLRMQALADQKARESIDQQRLGSQAVQKSLEDFMGQEQQIDLSALMGLADTWTGSNMAGSYKRPMSAEDKKLKAAELQDIIRKGQAGVSEKELELLRAQMGQKKSEADLLNDYAMKKMMMDTKARPKTIADLSPKAQIDFKEKYQKDYGDKITNLAQSRGNADRIQSIVEMEGGRPGWSSKNRGLYDSAVSNLVLAYNKDFAGLGALAGPDLKILETALGNVKVGSLTDDYLANLLSDPSGEKTKEVMQKFKAVFDKATLEYGDKAKSVYGELVTPMVSDDLERYRGMSEIVGGRPTDTKPAAGATDPRVQAFMQKNNIKSEAEAIRILKEAGKM